MKILILGPTGMLGHQLVKHLESRFIVETLPRYVFDVLESLAPLERVLGVLRPDVVINCIGIVKQRPASDAEMIEVNALFPHKLARLTCAIDARLIHFSSDCAWDDDTYGRTKNLGEIRNPGCLTLRTSIIGRERGTTRGLVEWFLRQKSVLGFQKAIYTGFTTLEMARIVERILVRPWPLGPFGIVRNVASTPITKLNLLLLLREQYGLHTRITSMPHGVDHSLDGSRFNREFNYTPPSWDAMIEELARECPL